MYRIYNKDFYTEEEVIKYLRQQIVKSETIKVNYFDFQKRKTLILDNLIIVIDDEWWRMEIKNRRGEEFATIRYHIADEIYSKHIRGLVLFCREQQKFKEEQKVLLKQQELLKVKKAKVRRGRSR